MREYGLPKVLTWRWTPCVALTLGAASFSAFAFLAIPDRIGDLGSASDSAARLSLGNGFASTQTSPAPAADWASNNASALNSPTSPASRLTTRPSQTFPKRGFTPPLERPEPPAPPPAPTPPPQVQVQAQAPFPAPVVDQAAAAQPAAQVPAPAPLPVAEAPVPQAPPADAPAAPPSDLPTRE